MITNSEAVSRVVNGLRATTKDGSIRWRYVLSVLRTKARFMLSQKLDELTLFKEEGIKTKISCFPMKRVKNKDCGIVEFRLCNKIMKSCNKLPEVITGKIGTGVLSVTNIDESTSYRYITANEYTRIKKRKYRNKEARYFTIKDGYLYCPESAAELLEVVLIAIDKNEAKELSVCQSTKKENKCFNSWDDEFVCPDRFLDLVVKDAISEIANFYRTSVTDENGNMDEHQKTKTTV